MHAPFLRTFRSLNFGCRRVQDSVLLFPARGTMDARFFYSLAIVVGITLTQSGSTQLSKSAQNDFHDCMGSPLFMTWSGTIYNIFLALPALFATRTAIAGAGHPDGVASSGCGSEGDTSRRASVGSASLAASPASRSSKASLLCGEELGLRPSQFLARVFGFYLLWLIANYAFQYSLKMVAASLAASLFSTCPALVAIGSVTCLGRRLGVLGWSAVLCTVTGSVLVVEPWSSVDGDSLPLGLMLALVASACAAAYKVLFKLVFAEPGPQVVGVILAWIGVYALTVGTALVAGMLWSGLESVQWGGVPWRILLLGNAMSLGFNFLVGWGIAVSDPLFVSLGSVLAVPLNLAVDGWLRSTIPTGIQGVGIVCIVAGFVLLMLLDVLERSARERQAPQEVSPAAARGDPTNSELSARLT